MEGSGLTKAAVLRGRGPGGGPVHGGQTTWDIYASLLRQGLGAQRRFVNAKNGDERGLPRADRQGVLNRVATPMRAALRIAGGRRLCGPRAASAACSAVLVEAVTCAEEGAGGITLNADFAELVLRITGSSLPPVYRPLPEDDPAGRCPGIGKARMALGWQPEVRVKEGVRRTVEWLRSRYYSHSFPG